MRSPSGLRLHIEVRGADLPTPRPTPLDVDNHRHAVATLLRHTIAYLLPDRTPRSTRAPRREPELQAVSITGFDMGGSSPVREYQPVVHRLRLSASP